MIVWSSLQSLDAAVAVWDVISNLFVKAHRDSRLASELLDVASSRFDDMAVAEPGQFLRYESVQ